MSALKTERERVREREREREGGIVGEKKERKNEGEVRKTFVGRKIERHFLRFPGFTFSPF